MKELFERFLSEASASVRFRWVAIITAWALCLGGWGLVYLLPDRFESKAQIYVDSTSILKPLLQGIAFTPNVEDEANVVRRALLARPNVEVVAKQTQLLAQARSPGEKERILHRLSDEIQITGDSKVSLYTISFEHKHPQTAYNVVRTLLDSFVRDSLRADRVDAKGAEDFLREQLADYEQRLTDSERSLAEFKKEHLGLMPDQRGDYFARLQSELTAAERISAELAVARRQRDGLRRKLAGEGVTSDQVPTATQVQAATQLDARIQQSRRELEELLLIYTEKHPVVISLQDTIERLEQRRRKELSIVAPTQGSPAPGLDIAVDAVIQNLQIALNGADLQVDALQAQSAEAKRRIARLRQLVTTGPEVEAELARLTRDYSVTKAQYEELLGRLETARISNRADQNSEIKFKIIEPPRVPVRPVAPRRSILLAFVLVASIGAGATAAFVLNLLVPVFTTPQSLRAALGVPVVGVVSEYLSAPEVRHNQRGRYAASAIATALVLVFAGAIVFRSPGSRLLRTFIGLE